MQQPMIRHPEHGALRSLDIDPSPAAQAAFFGRMTRERIRRGDERPVRQAARLAFTYAFLAQPSLRDADKPAPRFFDSFFNLARSLAGAFAEDGMQL